MDSPDKSEGDPVDFFKLMGKVAPFEPIPRRINSLKVAFNAAPIVRKASALHRELRLLENNPNRLEQIISPSVVLEGIATAIPAGEAVANRQFANHGEWHTEGDWGKPGGVGGTLDDKLPVERLHSPGSTEWFIELQTVPESELDLGENVADGAPITR